MTFHSMAETLNDIVDCRKVNIRTGFFRLNIEQRGALVEYLINACNRLYCDRFFAQWNWNENFGRGRKIDFTKLHEKIRTSQNFFGVYCEADVLGNTVWNKASFKKYDALLYEPDSSAFWNKVRVAWGYETYFLSKLNTFLDREECGEAVYELFGKRDMYKRALWRAHDSGVLLTSFPHRERPDTFYGRFSFDIALQCIDDVDGFVAEAKSLLLGLTDITPNINACISVSPLGAESEHMRYFGTRPRVDGSHRLAGINNAFVEWYPYYYILGAEWFNLLSPLVADRLQIQRERTLLPDKISVLSLGKSIAVQSPADIMDYDIDEMNDMKELLYPVLYPGEHMIRFDELDSDNWSFIAKPRPEWERIPVFKDEIQISDEGIVLRYNVDR